ncbi:MAG: ATP-binding protein [Erysipelothrix sp.]|nr:ATP-binding protein [Erysipelothrix sp.]
MIKQITLENIYNFKKEITLDFDTSGNDSVLFNQFQKDKISNFSLIYGKNNVGKSNFFRALNEASVFIKTGDILLNPYYPSEKEKPSTFEIIVENKDFEIRYGFELLIKSNRIKNEWMFAKLNGSPRESLIFSREDFKTHSFISSNNRESLKALKDNILFINYFNSITHEYEVIETFMQQINQLNFLDGHANDSEAQTIERITQLSNKRNNMVLLNSFLKAADLDITEIRVKKLNDKEMTVLEKLRAIQEKNIRSDKKEALAVELIEKNMATIPSLLGKDIINKNDTQRKEANRAIEFTHKSGGSFAFESLSSGTKQMLNVLTTLILNFSKPAIFIFDEIEYAIHGELIHLLMDSFKETTISGKEIQYLITTHHEKLLDYDYISNDNKILFKKDEATHTIDVEYISEYKLDEFEQISKNYMNDAFSTNPNTSQFYDLKMLLNKVDEGDDD